MYTYAFMNTKKNNRPQAREAVGKKRQGRALLHPLLVFVVIFLLPAPVVV